MNGTIHARGDLAAQQRARAAQSEVEHLVADERRVARELPLAMRRAVDAGVTWEWLRGTLGVSRTTLWRRMQAASIDGSGPATVVPLQRPSRPGECIPCALELEGQGDTLTAPQLRDLMELHRLEHG